MEAPRQLKDGVVDVLINPKPCPENPNIRAPKTVENKVLYVWREFGLRQQRSSWYLERYYGIKISSSGVFRGHKRSNMSRLPSCARKRSPSTFKY